MLERNKKILLIFINLWILKMITFEDTDFPIAIYKGDNGEKKLIYIDKKLKISSEDIDKYIEEDYTEKDLKDAMIMYKMNKEVEDGIHKKIIDVFQKKYKDGKRMEAYEGHFEIIPNPTESERIYMCAPSKAGKSWQIARYVEKYKIIYPDNLIHLISDTKKDENFDGLNINRIDLEWIYESFRKLNKNEERIDEPICVEDFKNSLVIFDDIDSIMDKKVLETVIKLNDVIYDRGRHDNISIIRTNHKATENKNGNQTKTSIENSDIIYVFPTSGNQGSIKFILSHFTGLKIEDNKSILKMNTRWVAIRKTAPIMMVSENLIKIF